MSSNARVLVINDNPEQSGDLTRKLHAQGYENVPLKEKMDALEQVRATKPDLVIIAGDNKAGSSLNLTRALKGRSETANVPIIMITPSESESERVDALHAGADACLLFPYHDMQLFGRIESLTRLGAMHDELRRRTLSARKYGVQEQASQLFQNKAVDDANFLLAGSAHPQFELIEESLCGLGTLTHAQNPGVALSYLERRPYDAILLNIQQGQEAVFLQFMEDVRRNARMYNIPIICMMDDASAGHLTGAYAAGAADVIRSPLNIGDFKARVDVLIRQRRLRNSLTGAYREPRALTLSDALTGLYNHGFLMEHLSEIVADFHAQNRSLSLAVFTIDNLSEINSLYGYSVGDKILAQLGILLSNLVRAEDLPARYSGHRFALVMPETRLVPAEHVAFRIGSVINFTEIMEGDFPVAIRAHAATGIASLAPGMNAEALIRAAIGNSR